MTNTKNPKEFGLFVLRGPSNIYSTVIKYIYEIVHQGSMQKCDPHSEKIEALFFERASQLQLLAFTPKEKITHKKPVVKQPAYQSNQISKETSAIIEEKCRDFRAFLNKISLPYSVDTENQESMQNYEELPHQEQKIHSSYEEHRNALSHGEQPLATSYEKQTTIIKSPENSQNENQYLSEVKIKKFIENLTIESVLGKDWKNQ